MVSMVVEVVMAMTLEAGKGGQKLEEAEKEEEEKGKEAGRDGSADKAG
jgi:pentose-5-phosphate-3-epimerase